jgi:hypothetical protein
VSSAVDLAEAVAAAIAELEQAGHTLSAAALGDGGSLVTVHNFSFGDRWLPERGDLIFEIPYNYPFAPIYPYYTSYELSRREGDRPAALQIVDWRGGQYAQISLRATNWNPQIDTAVGAVAQVEHWFKCIG